jgi:cytochrome c biogenesis protein CcmG/thiol:disulfide interchange protein DsbE
MSAVLRRRWVLLGAVVVAVAVVASLLAVGLRTGTSLAEASPLQGRSAPDFRLPAQDRSTGGVVRLSDLRGQVVVVNFWASWCTECHTEQAALNETWQRFRDAGVVVVGVDFEDAVRDARAFAARAGVSYPLVVDHDSSTALAYGLRGVPETYLVDRQGRLVDRFNGPVTAHRLGHRDAGLLGRAGS